MRSPSVFVAISKKVRGKCRLKARSFRTNWTERSCREPQSSMVIRVTVAFLLFTENANRNLAAIFFSQLTQLQLLSNAKLFIIHQDLFCRS